MPKLEVPPHIARPDYADRPDGVSLPEIAGNRSAIEGILNDNILF